MARGFSSIADAAQAALEAQVKRLVMFHYDQDYTTTWSTRWRSARAACSTRAAARTSSSRRRARPPLTSLACTSTASIGRDAARRRHARSAAAGGAGRQGAARGRVPATVARGALPALLLLEGSAHARRAGLSDRDGSIAALRARRGHDRRRAGRAKVWASRASCGSPIAPTRPSRRWWSPIAPRPRLGRLLLQRLVAAVERGVVRFRCEVLAANDVMRGLLAQLAPEADLAKIEGEVVDRMGPAGRAARSGCRRGPARRRPYRLLQMAAEGAVVVRQCSGLANRRCPGRALRRAEAVA